MTKLYLCTTVSRLSRQNPGDIRDLASHGQTQLSEDNPPQEVVSWWLQHYALDETDRTGTGGYWGHSYYIDVIQVA